jgi:Arc/MetJ-type ribon-helix-helix transcriptional regulator
MKYVAPTSWWHDNDIMVRTQIQLPEEVHRRLKQFAAERGVSLSEAVRRGVRLLLEAEEGAPSRAALIRDALAVAGKYQDPEGRDDVAVHHDRYLDEAFEP